MAWMLSGPSARLVVIAMITSDHENASSSLHSKIFRQPHTLRKCQRDFLDVRTDLLPASDFQSATSAHVDQRFVRRTVEFNLTENSRISLRELQNVNVPAVPLQTESKMATVAGQKFAIMRVAFWIIRHRNEVRYRRFQTRSYRSRLHRHPESVHRSFRRESLVCERTLVGENIAA